MTPRCVETPPAPGTRRRSGAVILVAALAATPLAAQTNLETNSAIQFNFAAPGAANLALGGAFIGLAFDGTAAYTNPAGLTNVLDPEAWVEARHWSYTHVYTDRGRLHGELLGGIDTESGLRTGEAENTLLGPSFVSYVHPLGDWRFAVYFHKLLDFRANFSTQGAFLEGVRGQNPQGLGILGERTGRLPALRNRMETDIDSYGFAVARPIGAGVSLGLSLSYQRFRMDSEAERFVPDSLTAAPTFDESELRSIQTQEGNDEDWSFILGTLWQSPARAWSVGAVYRSGADFRFRAQSRSAVDPNDPLDPRRPLFFPPRNHAAVFHVPDTYGLGFAWRPTDRFTLAVDYDRVEYSDLLDDLVDIFDLRTLAAADPELSAFRIDDADEIHLGAELWMPRRDRAISVRIGAWYDPDHTLRFEGENVAYTAVFRGGSDQVHLTAGAGLSLSRLQVDVAFDYSDRLAIASLSAGMRF